MVAVFKEIETQALALPTGERSALVARLLDSLDDVLAESPDAVAAAWKEEVAHRVADFEAGKTQGIPYEQVQAELRALIDSQVRP